MFINDGWDIVADVYKWWINDMATINNHSGSVLLENLTSSASPFFQPFPSDCGRWNEARASLHHLHLTPEMFPLCIKWLADYLKCQLLTWAWLIINPPLCFNNELRVFLLSWSADVPSVRQICNLYAKRRRTALTKLLCLQEFQSVTYIKHTSGVKLYMLLFINLQLKSIQMIDKLTTCLPVNTTPRCGLCCSVKWDENEVSGLFVLRRKCWGGRHNNSHGIWNRSDFWKVPGIPLKKPLGLNLCVHFVCECGY